MKLLSILISSVLFLTACGPEKTAREKEQEQIEQTVELQKNQMAPLAGTYIGVLKKDGGGELDAALYLYPMSLLVTNPGRIEVTKVPTIGGSLVFCLEKGACFKKGQSQDKIFPAGQFNAATFDSKTKEFSLYFSYQNGQMGPQVQMNVIGFLEGDVIKARVTSNRPIGFLEVKKVQDLAKVTNNKK